MKPIAALILLILMSSCVTTKKEPTPQEAYLNEVFTIIENYSINKDSINFKKLKKAAYKQLNDVNTIKECHPIIQSILKDLGDQHSSFMPYKKVTQWQNTSKNQSIKDLITFKGKTLDHTIGYIHMKKMVSGDQTSLKRYADSLQTLIKAIDNKHIKGWILDLRENKGGNCWPMLAGVGPLLGEGVCGYFAESNKKSFWYYKQGEAGINNKPIVKATIEPYQLINPNNPIAILTGSSTASSGEVVVTAFHNKTNTKNFGMPTAGLSTGNSSFKLSDGSKLFLTISRYADRKGVLFGKEIQPSEVIPFSYQDIGSANDLVIKKAVKWINKN